MVRAASAIAWASSAALQQRGRVTELTSDTNIRMRGASNSQDPGPVSAGPVEAHPQKFSLSFRSESYASLIWSAGRWWEIRSRRFSFPDSIRSRLVKIFPWMEFRTPGAGRLGIFHSSALLKSIHLL